MLPKYTLESEHKIENIDEEKHKNTMVLNRTYNSYVLGSPTQTVNSNRKIKPLIRSQQADLESYFVFLKNSGVKGVTVLNNISKIYKLGSTIRKSFSDMTRRELEGYIASFNGKPNSIAITQEVIKRFFKWLLNEEEPEITKGFTARVKMGESFSESECLSQKEIADMVATATDFRDKTLIFVTYEGGLRISETLGIKLNDIVFDDENKEAQIKVSGKTGSRTLLFLDSVPYFKK
ncbi:MAG: tyrosine-type recombinase/integrase [Nanoarchaeota archaeon]